MILKNFRRKEILKSISALDKTTDNSLKEDLSEQNSEKNLKNNLMRVYIGDEIDFPGMHFDFMERHRHIGSGLKLTEDGLILTAYHNIKDSINNWNDRSIDLEELEDRYYVSDQQGTKYSIDVGFLAAYPEEDIALIKARIPKSPEPVEFRLTEAPLERNEDIKILRLNNRRIFSQTSQIIKYGCSGFVYDYLRAFRKPTVIVSDGFLTSSYEIETFAGGIFIKDGEFAGLALSYADRQIVGARVPKIVDLIADVVYYLVIKE